MCMFDPVKVNLSEDLIVYKFLNVDTYNGVTRYTSPYYGRSGVWQIGVRAKPWPHSGSLINKTYHGREFIDAGVFHSYKYMRDAWNAGRPYYNKFQTCVCRFRIPKDATVYAGVQSDGTLTYASTEIIFESVMSDVEIEKQRLYEITAFVLKK